MPAAGDDDLPPAGEPFPPLADRLGYLLKHAQMRMAAIGAAATAPFGVSGRQLAVLIAVAGDAPLSQQAVAARLGVDRTTMVALIDELERSGLVRRHRDLGDRRRNVVELTESGQGAVRGAAEATAAAERLFLSELTQEQSAAFRAALRAVAFPPRQAGTGRGRDGRGRPLSSRP